MQTNTAPNGIQPATLKARVRPGQRFGSATAGQIVDATPADIVNAKHAIIALDAEAEAEAKAKAPQPVKSDAAFEEQRRIAQAGREALKVSVEARERAKYGSLIDEAVARAITGVMQSLEPRLTRLESAVGERKHKG